MQFRKFELKNLFILLCVIFLSPVSPDLLEADEGAVGQLIQEQCSTCHKFEGKPESKFNLKAPDLMWAGNKY